MEKDGAPLKFAVIGAGVSGLVSAYLLARRHKVVLYEAAKYAGGHTNTITLPSGPDAGTAVDTGFIVCNPTNYPFFYRLLDQLEVPRQDSDMCFGFHCQRSGLTYNGPRLREFLTNPLNLLRTEFLTMLLEQRRFHAQALKDLQAGTVGSRTLGSYLRDLNLSHYFRANYVLPLAAAIWSSPDSDIDNFPALTFLTFFKNHGMLELARIPRWQTIRGGSQQYVRTLLKHFQGELRLGCGVKMIRRSEGGVLVTSDQGTEIFDRVVLATHADRSLGLLADPSEDEQRALGSWRYSRNHTVLHTDSAIMPKARKLWASWNYTRFTDRDRQNPISITYYMNRLQRLTTLHDYFVSLNSIDRIDPRQIVYETTYEHPCYTPESIASQAAIGKINGNNRTFFCGAYLGYGFHEDGARSGGEVAEACGSGL